MITIEKNRLQYMQVWVPVDYIAAHKWTLYVALVPPSWKQCHMQGPHALSCRQPTSHPWNQAGRSEQQPDLMLMGAD